jgi:hypothetical protein
VAAFACAARSATYKATVSGVAGKPAAPCARAQARECATSAS